MQSISLFSAIILCQAIFGGQWLVTARRSHTLSGLSPHHHHRHVASSINDRRTETVPTDAAVSELKNPLLPILSSTQETRAQISLDSELLPAIDLDQGSGDEETVAPIIPTAVQTVERRRKRRQLLLSEDEPYSNDIFSGLKERSLLKQKKKHYKSKSDKINYKKDEPTEEPLSTTTETLVTTTKEEDEDEGDNDDEGTFIIYLDQQQDSDDDDQHKSTLVEDTPSSFSIIRRLINLFRLLMV